MDVTKRQLSNGDQPILGSFSPQQNRAILVTGLSCACVGLLATLVTLRWFALMNRLFRHRLVLFLILSDTFKAFWYFIFPVVVFARGPVDSSSAFCQASGFLLTMSIEASDFAILLIALHAVLYIFRPPVRLGDGGLYPYRRWLPLVWLGYPIIAASLAFTNKGNAYVTAGTYCYLPQRPFWYRLALAWIPRYIILITIIVMYAAISIYVHIKFRGFKNLGSSGSPSHDQSERHVSIADMQLSDEKISPTSSSIKIEVPEAQRPQAQRSQSYHAPSNVQPRSPPANAAPWDAMKFITSKPAHESSMHHLGIDAADFARGAVSPTNSRAPTRNTSLQPADASTADENTRKTSEVPTMNSAVIDGSTITGSQLGSSGNVSRGQVVADPLKRTRVAIRQQLRFLFIYPAVYMLMWVFPFANHCLLYSDYLASRPIFWLQIMNTLSLSLQAAVNCAIFSWREKPWRRIDENSSLSVPFWRHKSVDFVKSVGQTGSSMFGSRHPSSAVPGKDAAKAEEDRQLPDSRKIRSPNWWEEEGKKRKDSVWLGTDLLTQIASRQSAGSTRSQEDRSASV